jgi:hypothetical protein
MKYGPHLFDSMSTRSHLGLRAARVNTIEELRQAIASGAIDRFPNIGKVSKAEIVAWLAKRDLEWIAEQRALLRDRVA